MGRGVEYRYKLIQQHYESDDICFPGESILHLQRREGIVGSLKAREYVWGGFLNINYPTTLMRMGLDSRMNTLQWDPSVWSAVHVKTWEIPPPAPCGDGKRYVEFILVIGNRTNTNDEWDGSYISRKWNTYQERRKWRTISKKYTEKL